MEFSLIKYKLALSIAVKSLISNKVRAFLTALGIIFGVAAVIAMLAIGNGAKKEILEQIKLVGVNNIIVQKKMIDGEKDEQGAVQSNYSTGLSMQDVESIKELIPGIERISPELSYESFVIRKGKSRSMRLVGVNASYFDMFNYKLREGLFFSEKQVADALPVCVIGPSVKKTFFSSENPIGKSIKCGKIWFEVIGVIQSSNTETRAENLGIRNPDMDIYIPTTSLLLRYRNRTLINQRAVEKAAEQSDEDEENTATETVAFDYHQIDKIVVQMGEKNNLNEAAAIMSRHLYRRHNREYDFEIQVPELLLAQQQKSKDVFNVVLGVIAGISLLVGGIGIMNIMLATVMERIKEIGIRIAIGASEKDIIAQFLIEAMLLSIGGGLIGILLGVVISVLINQFTGILTIVSGGSIALSFGVSVIIGLVFGMMPAKKAAKQDPVESLRN